LATLVFSRRCEHYGIHFGYRFANRHVLVGC
jgi:hypothetical protein